MKTVITLGAALFLTGGIARAAHVWEDPGTWTTAHFTYENTAPLYTAQELSLDLFGSYKNPEGEFHDLFNTSSDHGFWGGGAGVNYFFTRQLGIGTDFNASDKPSGAGGAIDYWVGNLYLRFPIGNSGLAPYIYGGGGRGISPIWHWIYGGGVGLEYRFNPTTGIFTDGRFLWSHESTALNQMVIRAGFRLVF